MTGASEQMIAMIKSAAPLYQMFGDARSGCCRMSTTPAASCRRSNTTRRRALETNRQQIASDPRVQAYLMGWKAMFPGAIEIDVYQVL